MIDKLTTKQRLFVEAYLANPNATQAARKAGYKGNDVTLGAVGAENLKKPHIAKLLSERVEDAIITADEILKDVKTIAKNAEEKASDRLKAYEMLGKHLAMWIDKTQNEHSGSIEVEQVIRPKLEP